MACSSIVVDVSTRVVSIIGVSATTVTVSSTEASCSIMFRSTLRPTDTRSPSRISVAKPSIETVTV